MSSSGPQQEVGPGMRLGGPQPKSTPLLYQCFLCVTSIGRSITLKGETADRHDTPGTTQTHTPARGETV